MQESIEEIRERVKNAQQNYARNIETIEEILRSERGYVSRPPVNESVIALCSGGLDSTVMLNILAEEWGSKIYPVFFRRGARAEKFEEQAFDFFIDFYKKRFSSIMQEAVKIDFKIPSREFKQYLPENLAKTVGHPLRNSTMQNLAVMYAVSLDSKLEKNIRTIFSGSVGEDKTEPELGLLSLRSQTLNTCIQTADWTWQITSPLTDPEFGDILYKRNLIKYAIEKNIPLEKTRSCFSAEEIADGSCFACIKRSEAFENAGIKDPLQYKIQEEKHE
ncbi:7-cyano-7-deazaguanine synthase [Candidatus Pacearchaeota archaeon]|nr:7-cyano-7-deazaguanine synthase [Candidatus Pacearchaeota archaeon]